MHQGLEEEVSLFSRKPKTDLREYMGGFPIVIVEVLLQAGQAQDQAEAAVEESIGLDDYYDAFSVSTRAILLGARQSRSWRPTDERLNSFKAFFLLGFEGVATAQTGFILYLATAQLPFDEDEFQACLALARRLQGDGDNIRKTVEKYAHVYRSPAFESARGYQDVIVPTMQLAAEQRLARAEALFYLDQVESSRENPLLTRNGAIRVD